MADPAYQPTTEVIQKSARFTPMERQHLIIKGIQLVLSLVAFICEEVITQCEVCGGLYFFEFVSCSALLLTILMLVVYATNLKSKINMDSFKKIDFILTACIGVFFLIASIVFVATIDKTELSSAAVAFGFLASIAFLVELYFMYRHEYLPIGEKKKAPEAMNGRTEAEPLRSPVQEGV
ncbi:CKLF-like MARVEL transmembrane domain-containing protein 6 [Hyperolius riggenbachi]|uniref:CKLF-like MARVEL transmembrane domain-containing protein 6 n=1 Tax=Hyperolius riggenbachi TaxID=752182 RepID=UPI0035A2F732